MNERTANIIKGVGIGILIGAVIELICALITVIGSFFIAHWKIAIPLFCFCIYVAIEKYGWLVGLYISITPAIMIVFCIAWALFKINRPLSVLIYAAAYGLSILHGYIPEPDMTAYNRAIAAFYATPVEQIETPNVVTIQPEPYHAPVIETYQTRIEPKMRPAPTDAVRPLSMPIIEFQSASFLDGLKR